MRPLCAPSRLGALLGALAVLLALLVLPALHPAHATRAPGEAPALTSPGEASGDTPGECPICRGLARVRSATGCKREFLSRSSEHTSFPRSIT